MGKSIFSSWFREFATLIFTQTIQAFLLAIVMSIIVSCLAGASGNGINAAGLLAIIALSSFSKIELLVKNIFGVTSQYGDPSLQSGGRSFLAGMTTLKAGTRLLDNFSKGRQANRMIAEGKQNLRALGSQNNLNASDPSLDMVNGDMNGESNNDGTNSPTEQVKDQITDQVIRLETLGDMNSLTQAINRLTQATESSNKDKTQDKMEKYQEMIRQGEAMKKSVIRENIGATIGGTAGAIVGLAEGQHIAEHAIQGAGVGDAIGASSARRSFETKEHNRKMNELNEKIESNLKQAEKFDKEVSEQINKRVSSGQDVSKYAQAAKEARDNYNNQLRAMENEINGMSKPKKSNLQVKKDLANIQKKIDSRTEAGNQ